MARRAGNTIFTEQTVCEWYAFHYGGRSEIQFNIGLEEVGLRYGIAFSLEPSQSFPDISVLFPKIRMFNCLVREYPEYFAGYEMWHYQYDERSENYQVTEIPASLMTVGTFIFIGKIMKDDEPNYNEILETFDHLLDLYIKVESPFIQQPKDSEFAENQTSHEFVFTKKKAKLPAGRSYTQVETEVDIDIYHTTLQTKLQCQLEEKFGVENVCVEHDCFGNSIDIVVQESPGSLWFYEIKTASSARTCIRQAIGQLFEYAYGYGRPNAKVIIVAGEPPLDPGSKVYLDFLRSCFGIPIEYQQIE